MNKATKTNALETLSNTVSSALSREDYSKALPALVEMNEIVRTAKTLKSRKVWEEIITNYSAQFS
jgi:hypothetical protein